MNRLQFATALVNQLRQEKGAPLGRYSVLLAIACCGDAGAIQADLYPLIGKESTSSHLERGLESGQLRSAPPPAGQRNGRRYFLTPAGLSIVNSLLNPQALAAHE